MLINWIAKEVAGGRNYSSEDIDGYEINAIDNKFYVKRVFADCDDIGPLDDFKAAEDVVMKIGISLVGYEDLLWKVVAAQAIKVSPLMLDDGTANRFEDSLTEVVAGEHGSH